MKISTYCTVMRDIIAALLFGRKKLLVVSWMVTRRCNSDCAYCGVTVMAQKQEPELDARQISGLLDELYRHGTRFITFTGGEPLLLPGIEEVLRHARSLGIFVKLNTNGYLIPEKTGILPLLDEIQLSLDGPQEVHDAVRGAGSFFRTVQGLRTARASGVKTYLSTVISENNVRRLADIFDIARAYDVAVSFQPARLERLGIDARNSNAPDSGEYRAAIDHLIAKKSDPAYARYIHNSVQGLRYLRHWPQPRKIPCFAGLLAWRIDPQGLLSNCFPEFKDVRGISLVGKGLDAAMRETVYMPCPLCWCGLQVESNLIMALNPGAIVNYLKYR